jgi:anti-sigma factor RsiW
MTCREFVDFIVGYLDGDLPADVQQPFEHHLSRCPDCDRYLRQYRATVAAGRPAFVDPDADVPADVPAGLVNAIRASRRH